MTTCGWCHTLSLDWTPQCTACGGPMPPPPGMELGETPPPAPRALPKGFEFRQKWSANVLAMVGAIFLLVGTVLFCGFIFLAVWAMLLPLLLIILGSVLFRHGRRKASGILNAFRHGVAVEGSISDMRLDTSQSVNGRNPWQMTYLFPVGGVMIEGNVSSFNSEMASRAKGQPLWVLYLESDPDQNTIYPPIR